MKLELLFTKYLIFLLIAFMCSTHDLFSQNILKLVSVRFQIQKASFYGDGEVELLPESKSNGLEMNIDANNATLTPVFIVQNVSSKELDFMVRFKMINLGKSKTIYNRTAQIQGKCLAMIKSERVACSEYTVEDIYYCDTLISSDGILSVEKDFNPNWKGVPPGGFVMIKMPPFTANSFIDMHVGDIQALAQIIPTDPSSKVSLQENDFSDDTLKFNLKLRRALCAELYFLEEDALINPLNNNFLAYSNLENVNRKIKIQFSLDQSFNSIEKELSELSNFNIMLSQGKKYYWRLLAENDSIKCESSIRSFRTENINTIDCELLDNEEFMIYPNPVKDLLHIDAKNEINVENLKIVNFLGQELAWKSINIPQSVLSRSFTIDVSNLNTGIYYIRINGQSRAFVKE